MDYLWVVSYADSAYAVSVKTAPTQSLTLNED